MSQRVPAIRPQRSAERGGAQRHRPGVELPASLTVHDRVMPVSAREVTDQAALQVTSRYEAMHGRGSLKLALHAAEMSYMQGGGDAEYLERGTLLLAAVADLAAFSLTRLGDDDGLPAVVAEWIALRE
jgi:hypothetical protein